MNQHEIPISLTLVNQKVCNIRRQMRDGTDISVLSEEFLYISHGTRA